MTIENKQNKQFMFGSGRGFGAAALVRCVSGLALGWRAGDSARRPGARRGATLILIIGALALLSVVILSYFLIGKGDRRLSAAAVRKENIDSTVGSIGDRIATGIIAGDVFSTYVEGVDPNNNAMVVREAWDYPWTDSQRRTTPVNQAKKPLPPGTALYDRQRFDPRGNIPQSFSPIDGPDKNKILRFPGSDPWLASLHPTWLDPTVDPADPHGAGAPRYDPLDSDNWLVKGVDWAHISNIAPDGRFVNLYNLRGHFAAEAGFGLDANNKPRTSENLSLLDDSGQATLDLDIGGAADPNIPSHWDSRQRWAFRPVGPAGLAFDDAALPDYQWADTDGDGIYDARWCELVDATDPNNPVSLLPRDGRYRYFVAARIVDLSGLLNVNTAMDLGLNPANDLDPEFGANNDYRIGLTPSDVDLRTFLSMADLGKVYNLAPGVDGYHQLKQGTPPFDDYTNYANNGNTVAASVGIYGYNGVAATINQIMSPEGNVNVTGFAPTKSRDRYDYYTLQGGVLTSEAGYFDADPADPNNPTYQTMAGLFGLPDLVELLTYRGINDPANRSRLEVAVGGRDRYDPKNNPQFPQYSPLRDNRSLDAERGWTVDKYGQFDSTDPASLAGLMWSALDLRQYLTTLSGARPLRSVRLAYEPAIYKQILQAGSELNGSQIKGVPVSEEPVDAGAALSTAADNADVTLRDPAALFRGYGDVLLPFSGDYGAWNPAAASPSVTMSYGYNCETALRTAAAMTANEIDLYDTDNTPSAYTLLLDGTATNRTAILADKTNYPWWSEGQFLDAPGNTQWSYSGRLDLDGYRDLDSPAFPPPTWNAYRLLQVGDPANDPGSSITAKAINVFGIEAQPFITEVATFQMYTDAPRPKGDTDFGQPNNNWVTINGNGADANTNADFIVQCVAFQLQNPFDEDIALSGNYYVEFGSRRASNVAVDKKNLNIVNLDQSPVTLGAHETRVFFYLSQSRDAVLSRMKVINPSIDPLAVDKWVTNQLDIQFNNAGATAVQIPNTNGVAQPFQFQQLLVGNPQSTVQPDNREFRLWRVMRSATDAIGTNKVENDLLADRLRDPGDPAKAPTLDSRLPNSSPIVGAHSDTENQGDDSGKSITTYAWVRRCDDTGDSDTGLNNLVPRGALPAWTIERKFGVSLNKGKKLPADPKNLTKNDFDKDNGDDTFAGLMDEQALNPSVHLVETIQTRAEDKYLKFNAGGDANTIPSNGDIPPLPYASLYAEAHLDNEEFQKPNDPLVPNIRHSVLRPADMLLALGVSPWQDPKLANDPATSIGDDKWTTLGESLAMALGYDNPTNDAAHAPYYDLRAKTDRGSLRLDAFVPFYNLDGDTNHLFQPYPTDPYKDQDELRGSGVPLALGVFDVFDTLGSRFGSLSRPTVGVVNANTATDTVLGAFPMLRPSDDVDTLGAFPYFWKNNSGRHDARSDIASTITSYRDKTRIDPRGETTNVSFVGIKGGTALTPGYYNADPNAGPVQLAGRNAVKNNGIDYDAATSAVQIPSLRELPGFASKGELMAVRDLLFINPADPPGTPLHKHDMDRLGFDHDAANNAGNGSLDKPGVDSVYYKLDANNVTSPNDDQIQDDYDEKLAIANGVMNGLSVRSDLFAATFIVHGYQKADCDNLPDEEPLVPSIARRYLMIVDRSSVVRTGDKPRILVFKELPLK